MKFVGFSSSPQLPIPIPSPGKMGPTVIDKGQPIEPIGSSSTRTPYFAPPCVLSVQPLGSEISFCNELAS